MRSHETEIEDIEQDIHRLKKRLKFLKSLVKTKKRKVPQERVAAWKRVSMSNKRSRSFYRTRPRVFHDFHDHGGRTSFNGDGEGSYSCDWKDGGFSGW